MRGAQSSRFESTVEAAKERPRPLSSGLRAIRNVGDILDV